MRHDHWHGRDWSLPGQLLTPRERGEIRRQMRRDRLRIVRKTLQIEQLRKEIADHQALAAQLKAELAADDELRGRGKETHETADAAALRAGSGDGAGAGPVQPPALVGAAAEASGHWPAPQWKWSQSCHLFVATPEPRQLEALKAFAVRLGLKVGWIQRRPGRMTHFDLTPAKRRLAVRLGAIEADRRFVGECLKNWKSNE